MADCSLKNRGNEHYIINNMPHRGSVPTRNEDTIYAHAPVGDELWPSFELLQCANFVRLENFWLYFSINNLYAKVVCFLHTSHIRDSPFCAIFTAKVEK